MTTEREPSGTSLTWTMGRLDDVPLGDDWLTEAERAAQERYSIPSRRDDWRLGRWTAKHAIAAWMGTAVPPASIGIVPRGPDDGFPLIEGIANPPRISLSHRSGWALVAVAPPDRALGCDIELVEPRPSVFVDDWFTAAEREAVRSGSAEHLDLAVTTVWAAKECALKALAMGLRLDTREVDVTLGDLLAPTHGWSRFRATTTDERVFPGWWRRFDRHVVAIASDRPDGPPIRLRPPHLEERPGHDTKLLVDTEG